MTKTYLTITGLTSLACSALLFAACGGSDATVPGQQNAGGTGGGAGGSVPATGGSGGVGVPAPGGSGGTAPTTGGSGGASVTIPAGSTITLCPDADQTFDESLVQSLPVCDQCANARCVPGSLVPEGQRDLLGTCEGTDQYCVPEAYAVTGGSFKPKECRSLLEAEGRCISVCVPQVAAQASQLPQADCGQDELCAPCYNPIDGASTGACSVGCDTGPAEDPVVFASCGDGRGVCVPPDLVPPELSNAVPVDSCTDGYVCAPIEKANDLNYKFPSCQVGGLAALLEPQGACVPAYIVPQEQRDLIGPLGTPSPPCAADEYCAPCTNPLEGGERTGACD
jgi:hypothetical protein